jgi:hypothetical protein
MAADRHSERTAPRPRLWNRSMLRLNLICPEHGLNQFVALDVNLAAGVAGE